MKKNFDLKNNSINDEKCKNVEIQTTNSYSDNKFKVDINKYHKAHLYKRYMQDSSPGVSVSGLFDITKILKAKKKGCIFNAMMCYCILQASQNVEEFHYSIKPDGLYYYDYTKIGSVIEGKNGEHYFGEYRYFKSFLDFQENYKKISKYCYENCDNYEEDSGAKIATSSIPNFSFTSISLDVSNNFWDNFVSWGKFQKKWFKVKVYISLRFHHATVDGKSAGEFFNELQKQFDNFKIQ